MQVTTFSSHATPAEALLCAAGARAGVHQRIFNKRHEIATKIMEDIARVEVKFNLEQGKVHRNQSLCRHLSSSAIGMVGFIGVIDDRFNGGALFLGPAAWLAWPYLLNRVRIGRHKDGRAFV